MPRVTIQVDQDLPFEANLIDSLTKGSLIKGGISPALRTVLIANLAGIPFGHSGQKILWEPEAVFRVIKVLEGIERKDLTKGPIQYGDGVLKGLWRKHVFQASFMAGNILAEINSDGGKRGLGLLFKSLNHQYGKNNWEGKLFTEEDAELFATVLTRTTIERRSERRRSSQHGGLTGEYLVFGKGKSCNRYLWLATHQDSDEEIWSYVKQEIESFDFDLTVK